jgi:hypothetical protein
VVRLLHRSGGRGGIGINAGTGGRLVRIRAAAGGGGGDGSGGVGEKEEEEGKEKGKEKEKKEEEEEPVNLLEEFKRGVTFGTSMKERFTAARIDDRGLPIADALVVTSVPVFVALVVLAIGIPRPSWLIPLAGVPKLRGRVVTPGVRLVTWTHTGCHRLVWCDQRLITWTMDLTGCHQLNRVVTAKQRERKVPPTLVRGGLPYLPAALSHGAKLAACWIPGALAARAYEQEAYDGTVEEAVTRTVKGGCFAVGLLILLTQFTLTAKFAAMAGLSRHSRGVLDLVTWNIPAVVDCCFDQCNVCTPLSGGVRLVTRTIINRCVDQCKIT